MRNYISGASHMSTIGLLSLALLFIGTVVVAGCTNSNRDGQGAASAPAPTTAPSAQKGRAQIWGETCARCHNMRSPSWYSDAQWEVAMQHMRVRGYLTGEEHRQILEFLKSAN